MPAPHLWTGFNQQIDTQDISPGGIGIGTISGAGSGVTAIYQTSVARHSGGAALEIALSGVNSVGSGFAQQTPLMLASKLAVVVYVRFSALNVTTAPVTPLLVQNAATGDVIAITIDTTAGTPVFGIMGFASGGTYTIQQNSSVSVATNQWYRLELSIDATTTSTVVNGRVSLDDDTASPFDFTQFTFTSTVSGLQAWVATLGSSLFRSNLRSTFTEYITDFAIEYGTTSYIGPITVRGYYPATVGTHNLDASPSSFFFDRSGGTDTALTTAETTSWAQLANVPLGQTALDGILIETGVGPPNTPAFRAAGTTVFNVNSVANPTVLTPVKNASTVNGDVMVCITFSRSITATAAASAGWTVVSGFPKTSGTASGGRMYVFTKVANGTDTCTITWTGVTTGTTGDSSSAVILSYSNATETFEAVSGTTIDLATTNTITLPSVTTTTDKDYCIAAVATFLDSAQTGTVTTFTERSDASTTNGSGQFLYTADLVKTPAGATGTGTVTRSVITSARSFGCTIAMKATTSVAQPTNTQYAEYKMAQETLATGTPYGVSTIAFGAVDSGTPSATLKTFDGLLNVSQGIDTDYATTLSGASPYLRFHRWRPGTPTTDGANSTSGKVVGGSGSGWAAAQSFIAESTDVGSVIAWVKKTGAPSDTITAAIYTSVASAPGVLQATSVAIAAGSVDANGTPLTFTFSSPPATTRGTTYWIVFNRTGAADSVNDYSVLLGTLNAARQTALSSSASQAVAAGAWTLDGSNVLATTVLGSAGSSAWSVASLNGLKVRYGFTNSVTGNAALRGVMFEAVFPAPLVTGAGATPRQPIVVGQAVMGASSR